MSHTMLLTVAALFWPALILQGPAASQDVADREIREQISDSERALKVVLENRQKFWPIDYSVQSQHRRFEDLQISVKVLGEAQTAQGPRKLAVVQVRTRAEDGQWPQELTGLWVAYFTPEMKYVEHHNQGCGSELQLKGSVIHYGAGRTFDLSTPEGLAGFKATQNWC